MGQQLNRQYYPPLALGEGRLTKREHRFYALQILQEGGGYTASELCDIILVRFGFVARKQVLAKMLSDSPGVVWERSYYSDSLSTRKRYRWAGFR